MPCEYQHILRQYDQIFGPLFFKPSISDYIKDDYIIFMSKIGQKRAENDPTKVIIFMKNYATGNGSNTTGSGQNMI